MSRLIDKDALLAELLEKPTIRYSNLDLIQTIAGQPTVDAVPVVHGEWIMIDPKNIIEICSQCRHTDYFARHSHYCPNCGAKMDGKEQDDE